MKVGLVLEGGAMRGLFTAGVLDIMLDNHIPIDGIIGTSAGALFGPNYFSKQKGRVLRYNQKYAKDLRYISVLSYILTGNIVNKRFAFYKMTKKLDKFDDEEFKKDNKPFWAVATNIESGKPAYFKIKSAIDDLEKLRASSAVPLVSRIVKIDKNKYLDGGIADSIPIKKMQKEGFDKIIVVLTQPLDYRKTQLNNEQLKKVKRKYKKYPNLIKAMENRYIEYNETVEMITKLEKSGKVFVIRPTEKIDINLIERDKEKMQKVYDLGCKDAKKNMKKLKEYLKIKE